jgi:hypothetical protein
MKRIASRDSAADSERMKFEAAMLKQNPMLIQKDHRGALSDKLQIIWFPSTGKISSPTTCSIGIFRRARFGFRRRFSSAQAYSVLPDRARQSKP